jgi:hypothetical protein
MDEVEDIFDELEDPRTGNAKRHPLHEIVLIARCTVLCGGERTWRCSAARSAIF